MVKIFFFLLVFILVPIILIYREVKYRKKRKAMVRQHLEKH